MRSREAAEKDLVGLAERSAEAFNRRDLEAFLALQAAEVEGYPLFSVEGHHHGHAGTRRWWAAQFDAFPDLTVEPVEIRAEAGGWTIAAVRMRGHSAEGGVPVDMILWRSDRWVEGRCVWWGSFRSEAEALEAVDRAG
jgi:hypothetical protein